MQRLIKTLCTLSVAAVLCFSPALSANARADSYFYHSDQGALLAPDAYVLERSVRAADLKVPSLSALTSLYVRNGSVYIADLDKIIVTDEEFRVKKVLSTYQANGETRTIDSPSGIFVTEEGDLYVCEPNNARILQFDIALRFKRELTRPEIIGIEGVDYKPSKLVVDSVGRIYVAARNIYEGIIELNEDGSFSRFYGTNKVQFNPLELFWRSIATQAQRAQMKLWLPTDFSGIAMDKDGFIFATTRSTDMTAPIKKLNAQGKDILRYKEKFRPAGDTEYLLTASGLPTGPSELIAVDCNDYGVYTVLDAKRMRIFTYNEDGDLLYIFGGSGNQDGRFQNPVDLKFMGERILVLDQQGQSIEVMRPTRYAQAINRAARLQYENDYGQAAAEWETAVSINPQLEVGYSGMGLSELRLGRYQEAMRLFELGSNRIYYSKAYEKYRAQWLDQNFNVIFLLVVIAAVVLFAFRLWRRARGGERRAQADDEILG